MSDSAEGNSLFSVANRLVPPALTAGRAGLADDLD